MRIGRSVKSRIVLALILILVPAVILLAVIFSAWYRARYGLAYSSTHERAVSAALGFREYVEDLGRSGRLVGLTVAPLLPDNPEAANRLMATYRREMNNVNHLSYVSPQGVSIAGDPAEGLVGVRVSDRGYFRRIVAGADLVVSNLLINRYSDQPAIVVVRAMRRNGQLIGMVGMSVDIQHLESVFRPRLGNEILILLDPEGTLAYHSQHPNLSWDERRRIGRMLFDQAGTSPATELVELDSPLDQGDWRGDWTTVPGFGWRVGTFRPESLVTGPLQAEFRRGVIWVVVTLVILIVLIWYLGVSISRPATELAEASGAVASGDLSARARYTGDDELGQVAGAFNEMVEKLREARAETEARQQQLEFLYEAGLAVTTTLALDDLIDTVIREIARVTGASIVEVFLYDDERMELTICSQIGLPESNITSVFALGEGIPGKVAETRHPIAVPDLQSLPNLIRRDMVFSEGLRSLLAVPLFTGGELVGVIDLFTKERREFTEDEIELTSTLASIAATGIANARLYERERTIARTLEAAFVPASTQMPGMDTALIYRPRATEAEIGGDFVDVIALSEGGYGVVVGDVAGKGLQAAVYTNMIKYSLRAYAYNRMSPAEAVTAANRIVTAATEIDRFATLVYCSIDADGRRISWVSAGHEEIIIYRHATDSIESYASTSTAVGIQADSVFGQAETILQPGDLVVLYTDGITEARQGHEFFGVDGVKQAVRNACPCSAEDVANALFGEAYEFAQHRLSDDVAILVFGPRGKSMSNG